VPQEPLAHLNLLHLNMAEQAVRVAQAASERMLVVQHQQPLRLLDISTPTQVSRRASCHRTALAR
jgi:hypothetical protein